MRKANPKSKSRGFTLIEAVVATFLFSITVGSILGIYMTTLKVNKRADSIRKASENARFISELLAKEIRNGQIDYFGPTSAVCGSSSYSTNPNTKLAILNVDGEHKCFYLGDDNGADSASGTNLWVVKNNFTATRINDAGTIISAFKVYVQPTTNPYCNNPPSCSEAGSSAQPKVTLIGAVTYNADPENITTLPFQLSVSIPTYDIPGQ